MAGQIIPKGKDKWLLRVFIGRDTNGKRRYVSQIVDGGKRVAEAKLSELLSNKGSLTSKSKVTLGEYCDAWLASAPAITPRTRHDYASVMRRYVKPHLGSFQLSKLTPLVVRRWLIQLSETKPARGDGTGLGARTVRGAHEVLRNCLAQAVADGLITQNPARADRKKREGVAAALPQKPRQEMVTVAAADVPAYVDVAQSDPMGALWLALLFGGFRPGEALAMRWRDLAGNTLSVTRVLIQPRKTAAGEFTFEKPKTAKSRRAVPLPQLVIDALAEHRRAQAELRLAAGPKWKDADLIFCTDLGTPLSEDHVRVRFNQFCRAVGISVTLYALRHSCATLLLEQGVPLKIVSERLGHSSTAMTAEVYSHVSRSMQQQAADALAGLAQ